MYEPVRILSLGTLCKQFPSIRESVAFDSEGCFIWIVWHMIIPHILGKPIVVIYDCKLKANNKMVKSLHFVIYLQNLHDCI